ncbi:MAG: alginate export family protein [Proteobacteria bacterium]|nr:alginate export family protein [Pseudomonadota bacterium]MDA0926641.1 alginate export family protein [Pseudomonadota bacterium]
MLYRSIWPAPRHKIVLLCSSLFLSFSLPSQAQDSASVLPDWLSFGFEQQSRMQVLNGQFRAGLDGDDQGFEWRNALTVKMDFDSFSIETEVADMRTYFVDEDSALDSFTNNPIDILQANVNIPVSGVFSEDDKGFIKIGRFTMDQGSRRFVARNRYRNTINSFAGIHAGLENGDTSIELFYTRPTQRLVDGDWIDNKPRLDKQSKDFFWGAYLTTPLTAQSDMVQLYLLGADERRDRPANQRFDVLTTGLRLFRNPAAGRWHYDAEAVYQFGDAPALDAVSELRDHKARYFHFSLGYSFEADWRPRLSFIYHYGSGDKDPLDNESNELDHLFGVPRPDFGPTGLFRAFQRVNTKSPGLMLNLQPAGNVDAYLRWQRPSLAEEAQGWRTTRYRHPGGLGETFLGDQLESRVRWHLFDDKLTVDGGYVWINPGPYMDLVNKGESHYFYLQTIVEL